MKSLTARISQALTAVEDAQRSANPFGLLVDAHNMLKQMETSTTASATKRKAIASGLGRIVTDSHDFAESDLGGLLLQLADDFARDV